MNSEIPKPNNGDAPKSKWDILSEDLQDEIQEAVEDTELEQDEIVAKKAEAEAEEQRKNKELSDLVKEVISLRGGADSVKEGTWDKDQKAYIGENGLPTDYAHLMHYLKENPEAVETLTQERDSLLANVEDEGGKYSEESYDDYMRKFANPFADDPLAAEIAETNLPLEGETGEQYEARIRRNAELFRAAEQAGPRDSEKESLESYNKRIAEGVDAKLNREAQTKKNRDIILNSLNFGTTNKEIVKDEDGNTVYGEDGKPKLKDKDEVVRTELDPSRPIMGQILDKAGRQWVRNQLNEMYPRNDAESIPEWQNRVENEIGLKIWAKTEGPKAGAGTGEAGSGDAANGGAGSNGPEGDGGDNAGDGKGGKGGNEPEPFPRSTAFANNRYQRWYELNRQDRKNAATEGQAGAAEGEPISADESEPISDDEGAPKPAEGAEANPTAEKPADAKNEKGKEGKEFGEKAKEVAAKLKDLYSARWTILANSASIEHYQEQLEKANGFFKRKLREELNQKIADCNEKIQAAMGSYRGIADKLQEAYDDAKLTGFELSKLRRIDKTLAERAGRDSDEGTITIKQQLEGAKSKAKKWKEELEKTIARKDKKYIELHTENYESAKSDYEFAQSILSNQERHKFGEIMDILAHNKAEKQQTNYQEAIQVMKKRKDELKEELNKLPEDQRDGFWESHADENKKLAANVGEASRPLNIAAAEKCTSEELADEWREKVSTADALYTFFVYRRVVDMLPAISSGNLAAAKREYDKSPNDNAKADIEENLKKYFGASDEFIAQLRGTDGERQQGAA